MEDQYSGFLLVDKPKGITSFGVVAKIRSLLKDLTGKKYKVGHSGTLDPSATGLLILAVGSYTKKLSEVIKKDKKYLVTIKFGYLSSTNDQEGIITKSRDIKISKEQIEHVLLKFSGKISQIPPALSAIRINGKKAYELVRQGQDVKLEPRDVTIYDNKLINYEYPSLIFESRVSSGTYIRSLVSDIASELKVDAYMSDLRRLAIDKVDIDEAVMLEQIHLDNLVSLLKKNL